MPSIVTKTDSPFVSIGKLSETVDVLKKLREKSVEQIDKKQLFEETDNQMIILQINLKKSPLNKSTFIHSISLPNHWRHESDFDTCLIVENVNKKPLTDRDLDLDQTKTHYRDILEKHDSSELITEIIPMRELRTEFKVFEAKHKLCIGFDVFLCDRKLLRNKYDSLTRFLGKEFWNQHKKIPIPIDLTDNDIKSQLDLKLSQTFLYMSGKGDTLAVNIGLLKQSSDKLTQNLLAVNKKLLELFPNNIRSLGLKTNKSMAITFFLDCGFISDTYIEKQVFKDCKPIEEEFSHFIKSKVQVFQNGDIRAVKNDENSSDNESQVDDMEKNLLSNNDRKGNKKNARKRRKLIQSNLKIFKKPKLSKK